MPLTTSKDSRDALRGDARARRVREQSPSAVKAMLLDANVLIALSVAEHVHHRAATEWLGTERRFATCPSTQGSLARFIVRVATADHAVAVLRLLQSHPRHEFWNDDAPYDENVLQGVVGHRQVTDSYLAHLCAIRGQRMATFDVGLATLRPNVVDLIPSS